MPIRPVSPLAYRSLKSAVTVCTVPSVRRALSTPRRWVNSIVPSGANAMPHGWVRPETSGLTASCRVASWSATDAPDTTSALLPEPSPSL